MGNKPKPRSGGRKPAPFDPPKESKPGFIPMYLARWVTGVGDRPVTYLPGGTDRSRVYTGYGGEPLSFDPPRNPFDGVNLHRMLSDEAGMRPDYDKVARDGLRDIASKHNLPPLPEPSMQEVIDNLKEVCAQPPKKTEPPTFDDLFKNLRKALGRGLSDDEKHSIRKFVDGKGDLVMLGRRQKGKTLAAGIINAHIEEVRAFHYWRPQPSPGGDVEIPKNQ